MLFGPNVRMPLVLFSNVSVCMSSLARVCLGREAGILSMSVSPRQAFALQALELV